MWFLGWKGPSGFSASSTAEQVTQGIDGTGLTAVVTGCSFSSLFLFLFFSFFLIFNFEYLSDSHVFLGADKIGVDIFF